MSKRKCVGLVMGSFIGGMINSLTHPISLWRLSFCESNVVGHFFCDVPPLLKLSCSDTSLNELLLLIFSGHCHGHLFDRDHFLPIHCCCHPEEMLSSGQTESLLHVCLSPDCHDHIYGTLSFNYIQPSSQYSVEQV